VCSGVLTFNTKNMQSVGLPQPGVVACSGKLKHRMDVVLGPEPDVCPVLALAWNKRGDVLLSGGTDTLVKAWDARTGELKQSWSGHTREREGGRKGGGHTGSLAYTLAKSLAGWLASCLFVSPVFLSSLSCVGTSSNCRLRH
jgi:WD40 repeat protein